MNNKLTRYRSHNHSPDCEIRDHQAHSILVSETGIHQITDEQKSTIARIMEGTEELQLLDADENFDPDCTLNLPTLSRHRKI